MTIKYIDLFAGVGGFKYGIDNIRPEIEINGQDQGVQEDGTDIERNNVQRPVFSCVYSNEWDKYANSVYRKHYGECDNRDIREVNAEEIPDFDLVVGGVPCQSWSIAGKRGGFEDERGNLWFECFKILRAKRPKYFLFENVKGLLSHNGGKSMERICEKLCECGYAIDFEVLNSKNFGVPQSRERVFIIGIRLDLLDKCQVF